MKMRKMHYLNTVYFSSVKRYSLKKITQNRELVLYKLDDRYSGIQASMRMLSHAAITHLNLWAHNDHELWRFNVKIRSTHPWPTAESLEKFVWSNTQDIVLTTFTTHTHTHTHGQNEQQSENIMPLATLSNCGGQGW